MLVLTRKLMEKLYIGGDICVTVVRLEGSQVRLGIEAPREVPVVRAELKRHPKPVSRTSGEEGASEAVTGCSALDNCVPKATRDPGPVERGKGIGGSRNQTIRMRGVVPSSDNSTKNPVPVAIVTRQLRSRSDSRNL
jgi:carbon storage regulator